MDDRTHDAPRLTLAPVQRLALELYVPVIARLRSYAFELATAGVYTLLGVSNLVYPGSLVHTSAGANVQPAATVWSVFFIVGGALMLVGIGRGRPGLRIAGLILLASGITMQTVAAVLFSPTPRAFAPVLYAVACAARAAALGAWIVRIRNADEALDEEA